MDYRVPLDSLRFALQVHGRLSEVLALPHAAGLDVETVDAILEEAAKFAEQALAPTNRVGDQHGAHLENGKVLTHSQIAEAFYAYRDAGWVGLRAPVDYEGQGLPAVVAAACEEMWCAANLAFSLLPMLTLGAIEAIYHHASPEQKQKYLPKMSQGLWSGTMNLTEPQAGTDLAQVACKAIPNANGHYAISGQKIFITWGDQELTENVIHLVLARLPDAPAGVKGISLFIVPKFLVDDSGNLGQRNAVHAVSLEHKLGIHASPTCVMQFDEAEGYLVGEAGKGLAYMFTMMNHARLGVGIEGHAVAERAFQAAVGYAQERIQSRAIGSKEAQPVAIIHHPDVKRLLLTQKAVLLAQRALYMQAAAAIDTAHHHPNPDEQARAQSILDFLIPIVKAWNTDNGTVLTNQAMQVFGGMGYIEETGIAQLVRDVRITAIYEGANGIQALDLVGRKTAADQGKTARTLLAEGAQLIPSLQGLSDSLASSLQQAIQLANTSVDYVVANMPTHPELVAAGANAYLHQMACTLGAIAMARAYIVAQQALSNSHDSPFSEHFYQQQLLLTDVYFAYILPQIHTYSMQLQHGGESLLAVPITQFE